MGIPNHQSTKLVHFEKNKIGYFLNGPIGAIHCGSQGDKIKIGKCKYEFMLKCCQKPL